jgi:divalent anion:Na+ symporter, DASS family
LAIGLSVANLTPTQGLTSLSMRALGILAWAVLSWIAGVFDDYVVALLMAVGFVVSGVVPFTTSFAVFGSTTWWVVVGAVGIGLAVQRSGLLARFALSTLLALPNSFFGQCLGLLISGIVLGPTLASVTGKAAIASKFVLGMHDALGLTDGSKHSAGLFLSMFLGYVLSAPMYMTAGICCFIVYGLIPEALRGQITWTSWLLAALPAVIPMMAVPFFVILRTFDPGVDFRENRESLKAQLGDIGNPSIIEKATALILLCTLAAWVTEPLHHFDSAIPAVLGLLLLIMCGALDKKSFDQMPWSTLLFLGVLLNLGTILPKVGIDVFVSNTLAPLLKPFGAQPLLLLIVIGLITVGLRFVVLSYNALTSILMVSLMPVTFAAGIHPWILGFVLHAVGASTFFLPYQNPIYLLAYQGAEGRMATHADSRVVSAATIAGVLLGLIIAAPVWSLMGLLNVVP